MLTQPPLQKQAHKKRAYHTPRLSCYGTLRELTLSGFGTLAETVKNKNFCNNDIAKHPCR